MKKELVAVFVLIFLVGCRPEASSSPGGAEKVEAAFTGTWPQWRGPSRDSAIEATFDLAAAWPTAGLADGSAIAWRRDVGPGFSSMAIADGRLLITAAKGGQEWLLALDAARGGDLWRQSLGERYESFHGDGPRSTPAIAGEVAVAMGALGGLVGVRTEDGSELWRHDLMELSGGEREDWGFASSPLIDEGHVYLHGAKGVTALALELESGEIQWRIDEGPGGYASPLLIEREGRRELLSFLGSGLFGLDPADGRVLWRHDYSTFYDMHAADPILLSPDTFFISSNYATGAALIEVTGDQSEARWQNGRVRNHWSSSVLLNGTIYGFDKTFLVAVDPENGEVLWKQRGFGEGSLLTQGRHLLVIGGDGDLAVAEVSAEQYVEIHRHDELVEGPVRASAALTAGRLFVRGKDELVAIDLDIPA